MPDKDLTYSVGTVSVGVGDTTVVGVGSGWSQPMNVRQWDLISIDGSPLVPIVASPTDDTHAAIPAWTGAAKSNVNYVIYQLSPLRFVGASALADVTKMISILNADGLYRYVNPAFPDPTAQGIVADEGQFALKAVTKQIWLMQGGMWTFLGTFAAFGKPAPYDNSKTYNPFDVASLNGSTYVWINNTPGSGHAPPDPTYWDVLAAKGNTGDAATIAVGTVTTGAPGSSASVVNSGTSGAAVFNFTIPRGNPGTGDMTSTNYASEYAGHEAQVLANLNGVSYGAAQSLTTAQKKQALTNTFIAPTITKFTSGSGTYTTPAGCTWLRIRMVGGGAGGSGSGTSGAGAGGAGTASTWSGGSLSAGGAAIAGQSTLGGAGGIATGGNVVNANGQRGNAGSNVANDCSPPGGSSYFGGAGSGVLLQQAGGVAEANTGSGGGGGGIAPGVGAGGSSSGGAGGYVEHVITSPAATYTYTVGAGGAGGTAGASGALGGAGGSGVIVVEEHYGS